MKKIITLTIFSASIIFFVHLVVLVSVGFKQSSNKSDVGVVFGSKVHPDGSLSNRLKARLNTSIELYRNNNINKIFVSGGLGKEGFNEGDKMAEYLILNHIPKTDIIIDNNGNTTKDSVINSLEYKNKNNVNKIIAISQYFHIARIKFFYNKIGKIEIETQVPLYFELRDVYSIIREIVAIYVEFFKTM